jgi:hypothetical protein
MQKLSSSTQVCSLFLCPHLVLTHQGISHAYGGVLSALSIYYTLTPVAGIKNKWVEREVVSALYVDRREVLIDDVREVTGEFGDW